MKGWVVVEPAACEEDFRLIEWVQLGKDYTLSLPPKQHLSGFPACPKIPDPGEKFGLVNDDR